MQSETSFKIRIRPQLNAIPNSWWTKTQQRSLRGTPDFLGCVNGKFVALELKRSAKEKPDPLQAYNLQKILAANGLAFVVFPENWDEIFNTLTALAGAPYGCTDSV